MNNKYIYEEYTHSEIHICNICNYENSEEDEIFNQFIQICQTVIGDKGNVHYVS